MECKLSDIVNIQTKNSFQSLTSNLFTFISCFASEYLFSELGLSSNDSKIYNSLKAYFTAQDYPTDTYFQILSEFEPLSFLLSFFPKNKKDFSCWEKIKDAIFISDAFSNKLVFSNSTFETKKLFLELNVQNDKYYAYKSVFNNNKLVSFVSLGNFNLVSKTNILFCFDDSVSKMSDKKSMDGNAFFNSCEDLMKLSDEQRKAVEFDANKNLVILAGAGSGKTRTLSSRFLYLHFVKQIPLEKILLISFTRRAKCSMQEKTTKLYKEILNDPNAITASINCKTIDSFFRYLVLTFYSDIGFSKKPSFKIDTKNKQLYKKIIEELIVKNHMERSLFKNGVMSVDSGFLRNLDNHMRGSVSLDSNYDSLAKLAIDWQLEHNEIYTFATVSALLANSLRGNLLLKEKVNQLFDYVLIDEFQDINDIQDSIFKKMYESSEVHFTFVGDDDQSIYFWRGSNNEIIKNISKRADTERIYLKTNYRNNPYIVKAGNAVLSKIKTRSKNGLDIIPYQTTGSKIRVLNLKNDYSKLALEVNSLIEAGTKPGKIAILSRTGISKSVDYAPRPLDYALDALKSAGINYDVRTPEVDFDVTYIILKYLLLGLSKSEKVYSFGSQLILALKSSALISANDATGITPAMFNNTVFMMKKVDNGLFSKQFYGFLENIIILKTSIENCYDSDIEEIVERYTSSASNVFMNTDQNKVLELPIFAKLLSYSINNPFRWPADPLKISDFFDSFEESLDLMFETDDVKIDNLETVKVSTIHSFKGLEFDAVFVIGLNKGEFPDTEKLLRERYYKEQELRLLIENSKKLQSDVEPSIKEKFFRLVQRRKLNTQSEKFAISYESFIEYIKEEANLCRRLNTDSLGNYLQAYEDYISVFTNKLKETIGQRTADCDRLQFETEKYLENEAKSLSPEEYDKIKRIKLQELNRNKAPILQKISFLEKNLNDIELDTKVAKEILDLALVLRGCFENKSKISEMENYLAKLDYELEKKKEEERKLFYVAITRPSNILYLVYSSKTEGPADQSEFITEIPTDLKVNYDVSSLEERRWVTETVKSIENIYRVSNGAEIDDEKQIIESNKLFSNKLFNDYLKTKENEFFNEHQIFNVLDGAARDYFVNSLYHFFLQDYIGIDFTTEFLFNIQRSAEEFLFEMTGDDAQFPSFDSKEESLETAKKICLVTHDCITNPPTLEDTRKFLTLNYGDWKTKLKKCGIIHYYVRSSKFGSNANRFRDSFKIKTMRNNPDTFLKSIIDISNYRNAFAHNHKPVWDGDPKEDALNFYRNIILNFYSYKEIKDQIKIIGANGCPINVEKVVIGCKVYAEEHGVGIVKSIKTDGTKNKYRIDFECGVKTTLLENEFKVISYPGHETSLEKNPKQIFKSSIGKVLRIEADMPDGSISCGTGFIIKNNFVLTNAHVVTQVTNVNIESAKRIQGSFYGQNSKMILNIMFYDAKADLCLLLLTNKFKFPGLYISTIPVEVGDKVYCIGNTRGEGLCLLDGLISDINRKIGPNYYFLFNAGISNGNSGGPVLNGRGEVIGIASAGDKNVQNMNYAIPHKAIRLFLKNHDIVI